MTASFLVFGNSGWSEKSSPLWLSCNAARSREPLSLCRFATKIILHTHEARLEILRHDPHPPPCVPTQCGEGAGAMLPVERLHRAGTIPGAQGARPGRGVLHLLHGSRSPIQHDIQLL